MKTLNDEPILIPPERLPSEVLRLSNAALQRKTGLHRDTIIRIRTGQPCRESSYVELLKPFGALHTVDVIKEPAVRDGIKEYSKWPTIPQVYINGKFVGGSDIVAELAERGELEALVKG